MRMNPHVQSGVVLCALFMSSGGFAQTTASIQGTVTDPSGAAIAETIVEVRNTETGTRLSTLSDDHGHYAVSNALIGAYEIHAQAPGFQTVIRRGITLTVGAEVVVDFSMSLGQAQQTV